MCRRGDPDGSVNVVKAIESIIMLNLTKIVVYPMFQPLISLGDYCLYDFQ